MNLESVSPKNLNELEHLLHELQAVMRKSGLHEEEIAKSLYNFEVEVGKVRRARFDATNPDYAGY